MKEPEDILVRLADLHKQATTDKSHYYTGKLLKEAIETIMELRATITILKQIIKE